MPQALKRFIIPSLINLQAVIYLWSDLVNDFEGSKLRRDLQKANSVKDIGAVAPILISVNNDFPQRSLDSAGKKKVMNLILKFLDNFE